MDIVQAYMQERSAIVFIYLFRKFTLNITCE
jgi:hypothetical protein